MGSETQAREQRVSCTTRAAPPESLLQSLAEVELAPDKVISEGLTIELPGGARLVLNHPDKPRSPPPSLTIYPARIMLSFSGGLKIFVALEPCDMRKSVNGLHTAVHEKLRADPLSGALFLFSNKNHNWLKKCSLPTCFLINYRPYSSSFTMAM